MDFQPWIGPVALLVAIYGACQQRQQTGLMKASLSAPASARKKKAEETLWWKSPTLIVLALLAALAWAPWILPQPTSPSLRGTVLAHTHGGIWLKNPKVSAVILLAEIANQGTAPSAAKTWDLSVEIDGFRHHGKLENVDGSIQLLNNGYLYTYYQEDSLPQKALIPIPAGGIVRGFLLFEFADIDINKIAVPRFILSFADVRSQIHEAATDPMAATGPPLAFPGIKSTVQKAD